MENLALLKDKVAFISDMDGVVYHGNRVLPGTVEFVNWLETNGKHYLFLTNSSEHTPRELSGKLADMGVSVDPSHFYTSAQATASFLAKQRPGARCYAIGEAGLYNALYEAGLTMSDTDPDYVVMGETRTYNYERIEKAVWLILNKGARLIGTNPDMTGPKEQGIVPATGALIAPIELATGSKAYFIGKPNPLMMRHGLHRIKADVHETVMVGDRMDTDIIAGIEADLDTVLVLSGVTAETDLVHFAYRPTYVMQGLDELVRCLAG
ncbi:MAG: HAD family hydrolase [Victivallales bacterium]|nr:HAD family hydrolase [Victivallales bacterium]